MAIESDLLIGDKQYVEGYFNICELYHRKRTILKESKDNLDVSELSGLNSAIKEQEALFWQGVQDALSKGVKFALERAALLYGLDAFEKRVLLYFLYLELCHISENLCSEDTLLKIFDLDGSLIWKMRAFKYFSRDGNLVKYRILRETYNNNGVSATVNFGISSDILNTFSRMVNGDFVETRPVKKKKKRDLSDCEAVGSTKEPKYCLESVKLSTDIKEKIHFFLSALQDKSLNDLGIDETIKSGKGFVCLFYGPSGTGKSMLAEAIAKSLNKKLLVVEFPKITSRWYGETDKNIAAIFKSAKEHNLVICIDEADSLLYNRNFAGQEHDIRFVNIMLGEIERFDGEMILTTNMDNLLDPALERRVSLKIKFDLPNEKIRTEIWRSHIPSKVTLAQDVDFTILARQFKFSGGYIKNSVHNALRRIAQDKRYTVTMDDLFFGAQIEQDGIFVKENKNKIGFFATS